MPEFDSTVEYRSIPSLPMEFYRAGSDGSIWSCQGAGNVAGKISRWKRLKPSRAGKGYLAVHVGVRGVHKHYYVHRLVLESFAGDCPPGMEACHENGARADNRITNLYWGTPATNQADRVRHGTDHRGEKHYKAKLDRQKVVVIRRLAAEGRSMTVIARQYGVSDATISNVVKRQTWAHVADA